MQKNGWTDHFSRLVSDKILNRSIGATTTLMGLYRALAANDMQEGDLVVWEYALNEHNHITRNYQTDLVLRNIELFLVLCRKRKCRVVAAVFTQLDQEQAPERSAYYARLLDFFDYYGVVYFDVSSVYGRSENGSAMTDDFYLDPLHYALEQGVMEFISEGIAGLMTSAKCPAMVPPLFSAGHEPVLVTDFCNARFTNSIVDLSAARLPVVLPNLPSGEVIGIFCISDPIGESGVRCNLDLKRGGGEWFRFSTTIQASFSKMSLLMVVSVDCAARSAWIVGPGDAVVLVPALGGGLYYAEHVNVSLLVKPKPTSDVLITGILMAVPAEK